MLVFLVKGVVVGFLRGFSGNDVIVRSIIFGIIVFYKFLFVYILWI